MEFLLRREGYEVDAFERFVAAARDLVFGWLSDRIGRLKIILAGCLIAAFLVELFPTRIRYTSMSLPYHIGNGWFGGMLPLTATALVAAKGDIYYGLWYPIIVAIMTLIIGAFFLSETKERDIRTYGHSMLP